MSSGIDKHTLCCLHFDESTVKDECGKYEWLENNYPVLSEKAKFAKSLDTSLGCIYTPVSPALNSDDFTIDFWVYIQKTTQEYSALFSFNDQNNSTHPGDLVCGYQLNNSTLYLIALQTVSFEIHAPITIEQWHHIAIVRKSDSILIFLDGKLATSKTNIVGDIYPNNDKPLVIGDYMSLGWSNRHFKGCIDEVRISDIARWTEDFTPPTSPYIKNKLLYLDSNNAVWGCKP